MKRRIKNKIFRKICNLKLDIVGFLIYIDDLEEAIFKKELGKFSKNLNLFKKFIGKYQKKKK